MDFKFNSNLKNCASSYIFLIPKHIYLKYITMVQEHVNTNLDKIGFRWLW